MDAPLISVLMSTYNETPKELNDSISSILKQTYALKFIHSRKVQYTFLANNNLREISISGSKMIFVYEYCLSQAALMELAPEEDSVIVNLHNWNGEGCISEQAYELAEHMDVKLLTMKSFYEYIDSIK